MPNSISSPSPSVMAIGEWRKANYCNSGECVEVAPLADASVGLRDSKDPEGGLLRLSRAQMAVLIEGIKTGELDHLA